MPHERRTGHCKVSADAGRKNGFRLPRRSHLPGIRQLARNRYSFCAGTHRGQRGAHGQRLCALERRGGRGHLHQRPGRHQPDHRHCHGLCRQHSAGVHYRPGEQRFGGQRCVSGGRYHRRCGKLCKVQLSGAQGGGYSPYSARGLLHCSQRPPRPGAGGRAHGCAVGRGEKVRVARGSESAHLQAHL